MRHPILIFFLVVMTACSSQPTKTEKLPLDIEGHRGCRGLFPENSIEGFIQALNLGVNTLELDVVISADSQVVVSHEPWMGWEIATSPQGISPDTMTEKNFNLFKMTYAEIKQWDCGSKLHPRFPYQQKMKTYKPLLSEVFEKVEAFIKEHKIQGIQYNIEIKSSPEQDHIFHPNPTTFCKLVTDEIEKAGLEKRCVIQSFDIRSLRVMHDFHPKYKLSLLVEELENPKAKLAQCGFSVEILSPSFTMVTPDLIDFCHQKKMKIVPWTVNEEEEMKKLIEWGVDGIITDYPDLAVTLR